MTTRHVDIDTAQQQLLQLVEEALRGDEVIITRDDDPVARLVPFKARTRRGFGSAKDVIRYIADDFDETPEDFAKYLA
jgi:prevent-host-death family protein